MKFLKNKWAVISIVLLLIIGTAGAYFKDTLGPIFGGYEKSKRGFYFRFKEGTRLEKLKGPGYYIVFRYLVLDNKGDTMESSAIELSRPYPVETNNEIDDALQIAGPGSLVEILVPADSLKKRVGNNIKTLAMKSGTNAKIQIHVLKLLSEEEFAAYQNQQILQRMKKENDAIDAYAKAHPAKWILDTTASIKYFIDKKTENLRLQIGDNVEFDTEIYSINGTLITNSGMEGKKYKLTVGQGSYQLDALDVALQYLAPDESGTFLVPSDYGYGSKGYLNVVAPYTPLVVKLLHIKKINP